MVLSAEIINKKKNNSVAPNDGETLKVGSKKISLSLQPPSFQPDSIVFAVVELKAHFTPIELLYIDLYLYTLK